MTLQVLFWILMLLWLVLGAMSAPRTWPGAGAAALPFLAIFVLGWATFGDPIQG